MGRRKLEMKRIEDKSSRQVAFSKRRAGLMKKARHLSVLCDVDVGVVIFSGRGKLYEFCSGSSLGQILRKYERSILEQEAGVATGACEANVPILPLKEIQAQSAKFRTSGELLEMVQRSADEPFLEQLNVPDLVQLEEDLSSALMQTRLRKSQLMMEYVQSLYEKEKAIREENKQMEQKMAKIGNGADTEKVLDLNVLPACQMNCGPKPVTLPLFTK